VEFRALIEQKNILILGEWQSIYQEVWLSCYTNGISKQPYSYPVFSW